MVRWMLFSLALGLFAGSLLVWVQAPTVPTWKLAIVVGEFGHFAVLLPLILVLVTALQAKAAPSPVHGITLGLLSLTFLSLLRPVVMAAGLAESLPVRLVQAFGKAVPASGRAPLRLGSLWLGEPLVRVPVETKDLPVPQGHRLKMDFYRPVRPASSPAAVVVMIHGGGWDSGDRTQLAEHNHRLAQRGYAVAALSYRLAPESVWPAQYDDVLACLSYLKREHANLGIDPHRMVLFGRSAGGQLATAVAYRAGDPAIRGVVAFYAPHDLEFAWKMTRQRDVLDSFKLMRQYLGGSPDEKAASFRQASAFFAVNPQTPPTLLVHGGIDSLVWHRQSERLAERLAENGVPHVFLSLPWATHAFDFNATGPAGQLATYALDAFLDAVTR